MSIKTTDGAHLCGVEYTEGWFVGSTYKSLSRAIITAGAIGTAAFTTTLFHSSYLGRDFFDTPTYNTGYIESERRGYEITRYDLLSSYKYQEMDFGNILTYILSFPNAQEFLAKIPSIIEKIYPGLEDKIDLKVIRDPDTEGPLLELVFDSGLPVDEDFILRERLLFKEIKDAGIEDGLANVVFINA